MPVRSRLEIRRNWGPTVIVSLIALGACLIATIDPSGEGSVTSTPTFPAPNVLQLEASEVSGFVEQAPGTQLKWPYCVGINPYAPKSPTSARSGEEGRQMINNRNPGKQVKVDFWGDGKKILDNADAKKLEKYEMKNGAITEEQVCPDGVEPDTFDS